MHILICLHTARAGEKSKRASASVRSEFDDEFIERVPRLCIMESGTPDSINNATRGTRGTRVPTR
eukprot:3468768-Rhodomonas_salina.1